MKKHIDGIPYREHHYVYSYSDNIEISEQEFFSKRNSLCRPLVEIDTHISTLLREKPGLYRIFSKRGTYLPEKYKNKLVRNRYFDIEQTEQFLVMMKPIKKQIKIQPTPPYYSNLKKIGQGLVVYGRSQFIFLIKYIKVGKWSLYPLMN